MSDPAPDYQYWPSAIADADAAFTQLIAECDWSQPTITMFGKHHRVPRLVAWHGDVGTSYRYSGLTHVAPSWTPTLAHIRAIVSERCRTTFNSVLVNRYRDGADSMGWHSDDEPELGTEPIIASVNLGAARRFLFRHRHDRSIPKVELLLEHGSLLLMRGRCQHDWQHSIPRTAKPVGERINLTYRLVHS